MDNPAEDVSGPPVKRKKDKPKESCVIHFDGIVHEAFKLFSNDEKAAAKIQRLNDIKQRRLREPVTSCHRMQDQCNFIPDVITANHGYH